MFVMVSIQRGIRTFSNPYLQCIMKWHHDFLYVFETLFEALLNEMKVVILGSTEEWDILLLSCL